MLNLFGEETEVKAPKARKAPAETVALFDSEAFAQLAGQMALDAATTVIVDGYSVHVPNRFRDEVMAVYEHAGLDPIDLDGASGDDTERDIGVGSIDGDEPQSLEHFANILDTLDGMNIPYYARIMCHGAYKETREYMSGRGRSESQPIRVKDLSDPDEIAKATAKALDYETSRYSGDPAEWICGFTGGIDLDTSY